MSAAPGGSGAGASDGVSPLAGFLPDGEDVPRVGVVGHVDYVTFAVTDRIAGVGEITHARDTFDRAAGGGAVAAAQMAELAGTSLLLTALGNDELAKVAVDQLVARGVEVHAARHAGARTRRGWTFLTDDHERTITMLDPRVVPSGSDPLPWHRCADLDAVYFTGGDAAALRHARAARVLVATARAGDVLYEAGIALDVLVASSTDPGETFDAAALDPSPRLVVRTAGASGGAWESSDGASGSWAASALPGPAVDSYGCGDAFAAALAYGLGEEMVLDDALARAARCGALVLTGRGPYGAMLSG